ncbi:MULTISPECIES: hypothetical protein [unclassified Microcoleus]|uniref:hypothetical protein n=1 Tax=unclassified Microcoleus TaxID=2642155 RepID=UPI002FCF7E5F
MGEERNSAIGIVFCKIEECLDLFSYIPIARSGKSPPPGMFERLLMGLTAIEGKRMEKILSLKV